MAGLPSLFLLTVVASLVCNGAADSPRGCRHHPKGPKPGHPNGPKPGHPNGPKPGHPHGTPPDYPPRTGCAPNPTEAPTIYDPTEAPTTYDPTEVPTTYDPTEAPTTYDPTEAPTTYDPTEALTTYNPTDAPTTTAPGPCGGNSSCLFEGFAYVTADPADCQKANGCGPDAGFLVVCEDGDVWCTSACGCVAPNSQPYCPGCTLQP